VQHLVVFPLLDLAGLFNFLVPDLHFALAHFFLFDLQHLVLPLLVLDGFFNFPLFLHFAPEHFFFDDFFFFLFDLQHLVLPLLVLDGFFNLPLPEHFALEHFFLLDEQHLALPVFLFLVGVFNFLLFLHFAFLQLFFMDFLPDLQHLPLGGDFKRPFLHFRPLHRFGDFDLDALFFLVAAVLDLVIAPATSGGDLLPATSGDLLPALNFLFDLLFDRDFLPPGDFLQRLPVLVGLFNLPWAHFTFDRDFDRDFLPFLLAAPARMEFW